MSGGSGAPFVKVLVSGNVVEVYTYERMPGPSVRGKDRGDPDPVPALSADSMVYRSWNQRRSKWNFMRTVNCTFDAGSKFLTFTFEDGVLDDFTDVREANRYWDRFVTRLRRRYGRFQWAVVVEFQDKNRRGAVHYHMIANLPYIPVKELGDIWGGGHVWVERIDHVDNVGAYVVKYMAADLADVRLCGLKAWRTSHNVKRPLDLRGDDARSLLYGCLDAGLPVRLQSEYTSDFHGLVSYTQYNLSDMPMYT